MRQVIVGYDGSSGAVTALEWATQEARLHGTSVLVVTVQDEPPSGLPHHEHTTAPGGDAEEAVARIANGTLHDVIRDHGDPAQRLVASCTPEDLLVVGSRGRNPLLGAVLGSVSRACAHAAPCPVAVVRELPPVDGPVVVGVDSSEHARRALLRGAEEARLRGVPLHAVHAVYWDPLGAEMVAPTSAELVDWGRHLVETEIELTGVRADPVVVPGHASDALVRVSAQASLLVVGSRGRNPLAGLLLGSTSDHCTVHAACPTLIVR
jgi:nucleotide-binding universal stress UspA family protein